MKTKSVERGNLGPVRFTGLVPGQKVRGRVISRLGSGFFRIGAAGYVFDAASDLPLEPGQRLFARVEWGGSKVILRVQEENGGKRHYQKRKEDPQEIKRVLEGLGVHPDELKITEFQERLSRYEMHGNFPEVEPSDIWVLGILWTRGIKGGADAFSLISYYLREAAICKSDSMVISFEDVLVNLLELEIKELDQYTDELSHKNDLIMQDEEEQYRTERKQESCVMLNCADEIDGVYYHAKASDDLSCMMVRDSDGRILRSWIDNPAKPGMLIEAARSHGTVKLRVITVNQESAGDEGLANEWRDQLEIVTRQRELNIDSIEHQLPQDTESIRFAFWRKRANNSIKNMEA
ncbi:hypothetical protein CEE37_00825 [candidate division LCP-89 bacterium B3_LCP]|uniref:Uncharacterized protein n=1 Tax=candidate division LCP-89 bacterium B3_LCP TaxID=2012998 RepID=A0A532V4Y0_UNCL8|nr:MAG: hypothetical protein CEE37_00825 [candidate division LCP-89 bacterium B3_LCP]